jgi:serine/threonine protein kinase/tetratricopeptide (TPR) repeat protein
MIEKSIYHYKIIEEIGSGGMGIVYKAEDTKLKRSVALKFLPQDLTRDKNIRERFIHEAQSASALDHPNICTIHEINKTEDNQMFIAMGYYEGKTVKEKITEGSLSIDEAINIGFQVSKGLEKAHEKGIVHRDIKPANVMITHDGLVKILDFGLAKLAGQTRITKTGSTVGTISYMSPEQTKGEDIDHRTDIWSLGIVLYEMLSGQIPFKGEYEQAVVYSIVNEEQDFLTTLNKNIPEELDQIVNMALEKNPDERYQQVVEMYADLEAVKKKMQSKTKEKISIIAKKKVSKDSSKVNLKEVLSKLTKQSSSITPSFSEFYSLRNTVGRKEELAKFHTGFKSALQGRGQFLCVAGEAGIGKTTLVEKFLTEIVESPHPFFFAKGKSSERLAGSEGYVPILEALENLLQCEVGETIQQVLKLIAPTWYVEVVPVSAEDPEDAEVLADAKLTSLERMKRELKAFLKEISRIHPLVLFFDDLHWADVSTVDVLSFIGNYCENMPLLIFVCYRPEELMISENKFEQVKKNLQTRRLSREIKLECLIREDVNYYLKNEFPDNRFPTEFEELIFNRTEGIPLFMVDLLGNMKEREIIKKNGQWDLTQPILEIQEELPDSVQSMLQRKLDHLDEFDRELMITASVQGQVFDSTVLADVLKLDAEKIEKRLKYLEDVHFIQPLDEYEFPNLIPTMRYTFIHILYQNSLYETLTLTKKTKLSISVAETLLSYYGDNNKEIASQLAYLFETGRDYKKASDYFLIAAKYTFQLFATHEAINLGQRAITNAEKLKGKDRTSRIFAISMQLYEVYSAQVDIGNSINICKLAEKVASEEDNKVGVIFSNLAMVNMYFLIHDYEEFRKRIKFVIKLAQSINFELGIASAETLLAMERMSVGELQISEEYFEKALPILREKGSPNETLVAIEFQGMLHEFRLEYSETERLCNWALKQAKKYGSVFGVVQSLFFLLLGYGNQGKISKALKVSYEAKQICDLHGMDKHANKRLGNTLGWLYSELQDFDNAFYWNKFGLEYCQQIPEAEPEVNTHINLAKDYIELNEIDLAGEHLDAAYNICRQKDEWYRWRYLIRLNTELAHYWIIKGDIKKALSYAQTSLESAKNTISRKYIAYSQKLLGDIAVLEDRVNEGQQYYDEAIGLLSQYSCPIIEWRILSSAIDLAKKLKDETRADKLRARQKYVIQFLADSAEDEKLRKIFLGSKTIRDLNLF